MELPIDEAFERLIGPYRSLKEKAAEVGEIVDYGTVRCFSLHDPDGNRFGVVS